MVGKEEDMWVFKRETKGNVAEKKAAMNLLGIKTPANADVFSGCYTEHHIVLVIISIQPRAEGMIN